MSLHFPLVSSEDLVDIWSAVKSDWGGEYGAAAASENTI